MSFIVIDEAAMLEAEVAADPVAEFSLEESDLIKADAAADLASDALHDTQVDEWDRYWSRR